jgi:hypothetical protein
VPLDFGLVGGLGDPEDPGPVASEEVGPLLDEFLQGIRRSHPDERVPHTEPSDEGRKEGRQTEDSSDDERAPANGPAIGAGEEREQTGRRHGPTGLGHRPNDPA